MTRIILIVLAISIAGNAGLAWWGVHEHTAAAVATKKAEVRIANAKADAEKRGRQAQHAADQRSLEQAQQQANRAMKAVAAAKTIAGAAMANSANLTSKLNEIQSHANPTACIGQRMPSDVRRVLTQATDHP